jgi:hypothetical protein
MPPGSSAVQAQLNSLGERMEKNFDEVKAMMNGFDARVREIEKGEAGCQALVSGRIDAAWKKLDEHTSSLKEIENIVSQQVLVVTQLIESQRQLKDIFKWVLGIVTAVIIVIFIGLATGQATVIFR